MANSFLTYTNDVLAKLNDVQLTSTDFSTARGIQVQAKNAINQAIRYINQKEFNWPFNHATASQTLTAGVVTYSLPSNGKLADFATFRIRKSDTLGNATRHLSLLDYKEYLELHVEQEDDTVTTTLSSGIDDDDTTISVSDASSFDSSGTIIISTEHPAIQQGLLLLKLMQVGFQPMCFDALITPTDSTRFLIKHIL